MICCILVELDVILWDANLNVGFKNGNGDLMLMSYDDVVKFNKP